MKKQKSKIRAAILLIVIAIMTGCDGYMGENNPECQSNVETDTHPYTNTDSLHTEDSGILSDNPETNHGETEYGDQVQSSDHMDKLTVDAPEIKIFLSRLELFNRVCSCSRSIEADSNETDSTGQYLKVTESEIDTWEKWSELIDSVFCDSLKESAERLSSNVKMVDDAVYIKDSASDKYIPSFSYELLTDKTGNIVLKCKGRTEQSIGSVSDDYRRFYILEHSESGWKVKYILMRDFNVLPDIHYYDNIKDYSETYNKSENINISDDEISDLVRRFNKFFLYIKEPASISVNYADTDLSGLYYQVTDRDINTWQKWTDFVCSVFDEEFAECIANNQYTIIEHNSKTYTTDGSGNTWDIRNGTYSVSSDDLGNVLLTCHYREADVGSGTLNYYLNSLTFILSHSDDGWRIRYYLGTETEYFTATEADNITKE